MELQLVIILNMFFFLPEQQFSDLCCRLNIWQGYITRTWYPWLVIARTKIILPLSTSTCLKGTCRIIWEVVHPGHSNIEC